MALVDALTTPASVQGARGYLISSGDARRVQVRQISSIFRKFIVTCSAHACTIDNTLLATLPSGFIKKDLP